ncbi:hypothetical protein BU15DRAFT_68403 [Melanogaster broomeanus]|nr:hypothetical protein BU15DRAFT_68403 [Melanogaster broomeanus]
MPRAETRYLTLSSLQPLSDMPSLIPNFLASLQKALACLRPLSRPEVAAGEYQRMNAGCGMATELSTVTGRDMPVEDSSTDSQLPTSIHTLLDPSSADVTAQGARPSAIEPSHQSSPQSMNFDTPLASVRYFPTGAENSRATSPGPPQSTDSENPSSRVQHPVSGPESGEPEQPQGHPPSEPQNQVSRPSPSDLLALAKPIIPGQLQRYHRKVKTTEVSEWFRYTHPEGAPYFMSWCTGSANVKCICTDTDLSVPQYLQDVKDFISVLVDAVAHIQDHHIDLTLVLELSYEEVHRRRLCTYYFANHPWKLIFWVHPVKIWDICGNVRGVQNERHLIQNMLSERITGLVPLNITLHKAMFFYASLISVSLPLCIASLLHYDIMLTYHL